MEDNHAVSPDTAAAHGAQPPVSSTAARRTLEQALGYYCRHDVANFDAYVVNGLERVEVRGYGTCGVGPMGTRYALFYDPDFIAGLSMPELVTVMRHEVLHILLHHVPQLMQLRRLIPAGDTEAHEIFHAARAIAADADVNELLRQQVPAFEARETELYKGAVFAEDHDLPRNRAFLEYMSILMPRAKEDRAAHKRIWDRALELLAEYLQGVDLSQLPIEYGSFLHQVLQQAGYTDDQLRGVLRGTDDDSGDQSAPTPVP